MPSASRSSWPFAEPSSFVGALQFDQVANAVYGMHGHQPRIGIIEVYFQSGAFQMFTGAKDVEDRCDPPRLCFKKAVDEKFGLMVLHTVPLEGVLYYTVK